jgi:hypothetical protein
LRWSAGPAYAQQLIRDTPVIRCLHGNDCGGDDVELGVGERQVFGIGFDPIDWQPGLLGCPEGGVPCENGSQ